MPKKRGKKYIEAAKKVEAALASNGNGGLDPAAAVALAKARSGLKSLISLRMRAIAV